MASGKVRFPWPRRVGAEDRIVRAFSPVEAVFADGKSDGGFHDLGRIAAIAAVPHQIITVLFENGWIDQAMELPFLVQFQHRLGMDLPPKAVVAVGGAYGPGIGAHISVPQAVAVVFPKQGGA